MAQSGVGSIRLFEDFAGGGKTLANTADSASVGPFVVGGEGIEDTDAGLVIQTAGLSGVGRLISADGADKDTTFIGTSSIFDVALNGPLTLEARIQFPDLDAKQVYVGFLNDTGTAFDLDLQTDFIDGSGTTVIGFAASTSGCGFLFSSELTDDEDWHGVHCGGSTANSTVSTAVDLDSDAVAGEWQILKIVISTNGTAWWYINGVLKKTVVGAVSTTIDLAGVVAARATTTEVAQADLDYLLVTGNRDWTV